MGATTNPKVGLRYAPMNNLNFRASAGTGFRAPSMNDLYRSVKTSETATLPDPVCMLENDNDLGFCANNWETRTYLEPEPEAGEVASVLDRPADRSDA